ncbi:hypothetical protein ABW21_db0208030 [Orbilia brochopaga]|nr:hypothetical protein ABW21_db0208030 [Drechslerella brochopaga]
MPYARYPTSFEEWDVQALGYLYDEDYCRNLRLGQLWDVDSKSCMVLGIPLCGLCEERMCICEDGAPSQDPIFRELSVLSGATDAMGGLAINDDSFTSTAKSTNNQSFSTMPPPSAKPATASPHAPVPTPQATSSRTLMATQRSVSRAAGSAPKLTNTSMDGN